MAIVRNAGRKNFGELVTLKFGGENFGKLQ